MRQTNHASWCVKRAREWVVSADRERAKASYASAAYVLRAHVTPHADAYARHQIPP